MAHSLSKIGYFCRISCIQFITNTNNELFMLKAFSFALFMRILGALSAFLMSIAITRNLPIEQAGYYFLVMALLSLIYSVSLVGGDRINIKYIGIYYSKRDWPNIQGISVTTMLTSLLVSCSLAVIIYLLAPSLANCLWQKPDIEATIKTVAIASIFMTLNILIASKLQAIRLLASSIFISSILTPAGVAATVALSGTQTAEKASQAFLLFSVITFVIGSVLWLRKTPLTLPNKPKMNSMLHTTLPLWGIALLSSLIHWVGQLISGRWLEAEQLAHLAAAQRTAMLISFILIAVNTVTTHHFAALYQENKREELRQLALDSTRIMIIFSIPIAIAILFFSSHIMSIFGSSFSQGSNLLIVLSVGQFVNVATGSVGCLLMMSGHEKDLLYILIISSIISIFLSIILTITMQAVGTAIAIATGLILQNLGATWMVKKRLGFNTLIIWKS